MKHTATPWVLRHVSGSNFANQEFEIRGMLGKYENKAVIFNKDRFAIDGATVCMRPEDAAFIIRACNAHDDLVEALREAHDALFNGHPVTVGLENQINAAFAKATHE